MDGKAAASTGHPVANLVTVQPIAYCNDCSGGGIAKRHRLIQAVERRFDRRNNSFTARFVHHLPHQVRT